jgi:hypothetical protein
MAPRFFLWHCLSTTQSKEREKQFFRVTHPFHPLYDCEFELIEYHQAWGEDRVYFLDSSGQLQRLPGSWTDVVGEDPFVAVAQGRSPLRVKELLKLVDLVEQLRLGDDV